MREFATWAELSAEQLRSRPNDIAFIAGKWEVTYATFDNYCIATAAWLAQHGVKRGDVVAIWMVNRLEWLVLYFALTRLGAAVMTINTRYRSHEVAYILAQSRATMLVLEISFRKIDFPGILAGIDPTSSRFLKQVIVLNNDSEERSKDLLGHTVVPFNLATLTNTDAPLNGEPQDLNILFTTSGTTSNPKLVMHSQSNMVMHSQRVGRMYGLAGHNARLLAALPFGGVFGFNAVMGAFAVGAVIVLMETFDGPRAAALIREHHITHVFGSDEMFRRILEVTPGDCPFPSIQVLGFAAFQPGMNEFGRAAWSRRVPLRGVYGSSEVQALFALQKGGQAIDEMLLGGGTPANASAQIRIRDVDTGELLPAGQSGVIEIRSDTNFIGYFNQPEATRAVVDDEGFFSTGDIGYQRNDGSLVYLTRLGDAMRLAGYLVSPVEIEDVLKQLPGIMDAQVVAVEVCGKRRCAAFVTVRDPTEPVDEEVLRAEVGKRLAAFKVPVKIWPIDAFPTTQSANGVKIQRGRLRELAAEKLREGS